MICFAGYFYAVKLIEKNENASETYARIAISDVLKELNIDTFFKYYHPSLREKIDKAILSQLFHEITTLGNIIEIKEADGDVIYLVNYKKATLNISAKYSFNVIFAQGPAKVSVNLIREDERWYIKGMNVDSQAFSFQEKNNKAEEIEEKL